MNNSQYHLIDAHCHHYPCYSGEELLKSAIDNFTQQSITLETPNCSPGCLMLADLQWGSLEQRIDKLHSGLSNVDLKLNATDEPYSMQVMQAENNLLTVIFGYQLITSENLEVLVYGLPKAIPANLSLAKVLEHAQLHNALAIVPWGFGKWLSRRGRIVQHQIDNKTSHPGSQWYVGDNGGRWRGSKLPALLDSAAKKKIWNIPGSDPLPFASEVQRIGRTGFLLQEPVDQNRMLASIQQFLRSAEQPPVIFGRGEKFHRVVHHQIRMQIKNRQPKRDVA